MYASEGKQTFAVDYRYFFNLEDDEQQSILNYTLDIYVCDGTPSEILEWFRVINIAGMKLTDQELRNTAYTGTWLADAKFHFSKPNCAAYNMGKDYVSGSPIRQEFLQTAIQWAANKDNIESIEEYMALHQNDDNANQLWLYFRKVIEWVEAIFPHKRSQMKGIDWGILYNQHKDDVLDPSKLEERISELMMDDDVTKKAGIYEYLLTGKEKYLNIRAFTPAMKVSAYERQHGICPLCKDKFSIKEMEGDHITPWHENGKTNAENCQMLCKECNRRKSGK